MKLTGSRYIAMKRNLILVDLNLMVYRKITNPLIFPVIAMLSNCEQCSVTFTECKTICCDEAMN